MEDKKSTVILTVIAVATLLVSLVGATFAYFSTTGDTYKEAAVTVKTGSAGLSAFDIDNAIDISANASNFGKESGSKTGTATGTVTWTAPKAIEGVEDTSTYDFCYTVAINISDNDFIYTVNEETPELTLNVTKGATTIISNKDITKFKGDITIPSSNEENASNINKLSATAGNSAIDVWKATVTLVNLETPQNDNTGKTLKGLMTFTSVTCTE